jgi:hypothetical protein
MVYIKRKKIDEESIGTDRLEINPTDDCIASIKNVVVNFDETVSVRLLGFHVKDNKYCTTYKETDVEECKCFCDNKTVKYVHFYFSIDGYDPNETEYLIAFLPRSKTTSELSVLTRELCTVAEWLGTKQINCLIFKFGAPVHGMGDSMHWQKQLDKNIKETKALSLISAMRGRIKDIPVSLRNKNLTISKNFPMENINVS